MVSTIATTVPRLEWPIWRRLPVLRAGSARRFGLARWFGAPKRRGSFGPSEDPDV